MKVHYPKLYNMAHLLALNVLLLPKDLTIIFICKRFKCHRDNEETKFSLSRVALNQIYFSFVLPVLEYFSVVWDGCSKSDEETFERLQNEAARIVTGLTRSVSLENLYAECGWSSLAERRKHNTKLLLCIEPKIIFYQYI